VKTMLKPKYLPWAAALLGIAVCLLRGSLYAFFVDARGLLPASHPVVFAMWILTAVVALLGVLPVARLTGSEQYEDNFSASLPGAVGHILLSAGILLTVLLHAPAMPGIVGQLWKLLGIAAAPLLLYAGFSRAMGKKPFFLTYVVVSVFFAFHLVCHYRTWCSDPQLQNYVFAFTGTLGLMLLAYYHGAACVGMGSRRMLLMSGLLAAYLCLGSLPNAQYLWLYLGGAIWSLTSLCHMEGMLSQNEKAGDDDASQ